MNDFETARKNMVDCQIHTQDVTNYAILDAFLEVPRERFVSAAQRPVAYMDEDIEIATDPVRRYLMEPMTLARLVHLADIRIDDFVLDVGCATGYSTAILAKVASSVVAVESDEQLAGQASETLLDLGIDNAVVVTGPLEKGCAKEGPYDAIFVGGAVEQMPTALLDQLKDGGRLVCVVGHGNAGEARLYRKENGLIGESVAFNSAVKPLPGFEKPREFVF